MTTAIIETRGLLVASRADRVVRALLLPFGEVGRTNLGRFSVDRGVFTLPADPDIVTFNDLHERTAPIGRAVELEETDDGVVATFRIANTPEGDAALDDIDAGRRRSVSAEVADVVIRAGKAIAGRLFGAALVPVGAFPSATLLAADVGEDPKPTEGTNREEATMPCANCGQVHAAGVACTSPSTSAVGTLAASQAPAEPTTTATAPTTAPAAPGPVEPATLAAQLPAGMRPAGAPAPGGDRGLTINEPRDLFAALARAHATGDFRSAAEAFHTAGVREAGDLFAALSDVRYTGTGTPGNAINQPAWLGKLWNGSPYQRRITPLFTNLPLTSLQVQGWDWTTKPVVGRYSGNKAAVPSATVAAERKDPWTAQRFAGAHDIDRAYRDFPNEEFWAEYFAAMTESYARESDWYAFETAKASATALTAGTASADIPRVLVKIVDGALKVNRVAAPTFAVLSEADWREYALIPHDHVLALLSSSLTNLTEGQVANFKVMSTPYQADETTPFLPDGEVLVGTQAAVKFRELPGTPIRVEGLDIAKGGIDPALFGYALTYVENARGLQLVTDEPASGGA